MKSPRTWTGSNSRAMACSPALGLARRSPPDQRPATRNSPEAASWTERLRRPAGHFGRAPGALGVSCVLARLVVAATALARPAMPRHPERHWSSARQGRAARPRSLTTRPARKSPGAELRAGYDRRASRSAASHAQVIRRSARLATRASPMPAHRGTRPAHRSRPRSAPIPAGWHPGQARAIALQQTRSRLAGHAAPLRTEGPRPRVRPLLPPQLPCWCSGAGRAQGNEDTIRSQTHAGRPHPGSRMPAGRQLTASDSSEACQGSTEVDPVQGSHGARHRQAPGPWHQPWIPGLD